MKPTFTADWFSSNIPVWEKHIKPLFEGKPVNWLELGSHEGRSALWVLDNILTHKHATITCVDLWGGELWSRFRNNIDMHTWGVSKVAAHRKDVVQFLCEAVSSPQPQVFDAVYVDADHQAKSALTEAALAWRLLRKGGVLVWDDYLWKHPESDPDRHRKLGPKEGIDAFLKCWQYELKVLHMGYQVLIQKL